MSNKTKYLRISEKYHEALTIYSEASHSSISEFGETMIHIGLDDYLNLRQGGTAAIFKNPQLEEVDACEYKSAILALRDAFEKLDEDHPAFKDTLFHEKMKALIDFYLSRFEDSEEVKEAFRKNAKIDDLNL